jgi:chromate transport protein ChrA
MTDIVQPAPTTLAARLGWRVEERPRPGFAHVLGAAAGAFLVVAVVAFVVEVTSDDPTTPGVLFDLALVVLALVAGFRAPGPLRSGA